MTVRCALGWWFVAVSPFLFGCSPSAGVSDTADGGSTGTLGCGSTGAPCSTAGLGSPERATSGSDAGGALCCPGGSQSDEAGMDAGLASEPSIRIAAGESTPYTDPQGHVWAADNSYSGGIAATTANPVPIAGTTTPQLYNSQRYGSSGSPTATPAPFSYSLHVSPGPHVVTLEFAETFVTSAGQRLFNVAINGASVLSEFDVFAAAHGAMNTAVDKSFPVTVGSSGQLSIDFQPGSVQNPMVNAIVVAPGGTVSADAGSGYVDAGSGHVDAGHAPGDAGSGHPIEAPLTGSVTAGTWQAADLSVPGVALPSGKPFHYNYLLPAQYDPSSTYPILVHEHEDTEGDPWYDGDNTDPLYLTTASGADGWYNNTAWRTAYPCIIILPYADQTANGTDGDDALENFGGWTNTGVTGTGTTFSGDSGPNVFAVAGVVQSFIQNYSVNQDKVYITGDSLGGIGSWYMMLMYNRVNGPSGKLFTAGLPFAGVLEINGFGSGPTAAQVAQLKTVPVFAVSGANDTTSNPQDWNQPLWSALAGNTNYPGPPSGAAAGTSSFRYLQDPSLGHDVWDTYRLLPAGQPMYDWLFSQ